MKNISRIISVVLIVVLCMTSLSFASTKTPNYNDTSQSTVTATATATLIRTGGNYQLWNGVPSSFGNLTWSAWATHASPIDAATPLSVVAGGVALIKSGARGGWGLIGAALLTNEINNLIGELFFRNIANNATLVSGKKTAYARVYDSYAQSASGTLQYSKVYVKYYSNSTYSTCVGTTNTLCLYSWPTGSKVVGN